MTEQEWLDCDDPWRMLLALQEKLSRRKRTLFACACARRIWQLITDERSRLAVEIAEQFPGEEQTAERSGAVKAALSVFQPRTLLTEDSVTYFAAIAAWLAAAGAVAAARSARIAANWHLGNCPGCRKGSESAAQTAILRDIFGNHFHHVVLDPAWLTPTRLALAASAYEERELPSGHLDADRLADALEETGCTERPILDHLRGPGPHVRGCWAVDAILARE